MLKDRKGKGCGGRAGGWEEGGEGKVGSAP